MVAKEVQAMETQFGAGIALLTGTPSNCKLYKIINTMHKLFKIVIVMTKNNSYCIQIATIFTESFNVILLLRNKTHHYRQMIIKVQLLFFYQLEQQPEEAHVEETATSATVSVNHIVVEEDCSTSTDIRSLPFSYSKMYAFLPQNVS